MSGYVEPIGGTTTNPSTTRFGNKPIRALMKLMSGVELDTAPSYGNDYIPSINTPFDIRHSKLRLRDDDASHFTDFIMSALAANQRIRIPVLENTESGSKIDDWMLLKQTQTMLKKTIPITGSNANVIQDLTATTSHVAAFSAGGVLEKKTISSLSIPEQNIAWADYDVYISGGEVRARNNRTGLIQFTHANDVGSVISSIIAANTSTGCTVAFSRDLFTIHSVVTIPTTNAGTSKPWQFFGYKPSQVRDFGTQFKTGSSFPDGRYMFECVAGDGTNENATLRIDGLFANNLDFAKSGNGTDNILGSGLGRKDVGLLKFEADRTTTVGGGTILHLEDIAGHYLWRGIDIRGYVYWPVIWNCSFSDFNKDFVGDFDLRFSRGTGGVQHGSTVENKGADIRNFRVTHISGEDSGLGSMNNSVIFFGGYHNVHHMFINGRKYNDACIAWKQCFSSVFTDLKTIDLIPTQGAGFQSVFLFDTADPDGQAATSGYTTYDNHIRNLTGQNTNGSIKFINGPFRNMMEMSGFWGNTITVNDAGAGINNVIEIIEGQQQAASTNVKVTSTNNLVKIVDKRVGASRRGIRTDSGTGSQTVFNIPHGCFTTPVDYDARPISDDALGPYTLTAGASNITVTYAFPPRGGTDNLKWKWVAEVYA